MDVVEEEGAVEVEEAAVAAREWEVAAAHEWEAAECRAPRHRWVARHRLAAGRGPVAVCRGLRAVSRARLVESALAAHVQVESADQLADLRHLG